MTVQSTLSFIDYVGDDVTLSFNFTFRADDVAWVLVDFTDDFDAVTLNLDQDASPGGSVSYLIAPPLLQPIRIQRNTPIDQQLDLQRYDPFDSESNEDTYDKLTMMIQDGVDALSNLVAPVTIEGSLLRGDLLSGQWIEFSDFILPLTDGAPGQFLFTDGAGVLNWANIAAGSLTGSVDGALLRYNLGANVYQEFTSFLLPVADGVAGEVLATDGLGQLSFVGPGVSGIDTFTYQFDTTLSGNTTAGQIRLDAVNPALAGLFIINATDADGNDLTADLDRLDYAKVLTVRQVNDPTKFLKYSVRSDPSKISGQYAPAISLIEVGTLPDNNATVSVELGASPYFGNFSNLTLAGAIPIYNSATGRFDTLSDDFRFIASGGIAQLRSGGSNNLELQSNFRVQIRQPFYIGEQGANSGGVATFGSVWVRNDVPNVLMFTDDVATDQILDPSVSDINVQDGNYNLLIGDKGKTITKNAGGVGETYTIPANGSVAFKLGTMIGFSNNGGGDLSIAITTDTLVGTDGITGTRTLGDNEEAVIKKIGVTTWKYVASDL